jgi:hypothetical protein
MEEKVYSRSVNKTNLAARVIDNKDPQRNFSSKQLEDVMKLDNWVECDRCYKWRMLPPWVDVEDLPDKWYCSMNEDKKRSSCNAKERDAEYYHTLFQFSENAYIPSSQDMSIDESQPDESAVPVNRDDADDTEEKTKRDVILERLARTFMPSSSSATAIEKTEQNKNNSNAVISKYYFHESLMKDYVKS